MFDKISVRMLYQTLVVIIVIAINVIYVNYRLSASEKKYVFANTNAISQRFLSATIRADLSEDIYKDLLKTFDKTLTEVINDVSDKNNVIILKQSVVLTELPEVTLKVEELLWKRMNLDQMLLKQNSR